MNKNFEEEQEYLKETIRRFDEMIEEIGLRLEALPRMYYNNPLLLESLLNTYRNRLELIKKTINKPYFARIDFHEQATDKLYECYIGKVGISDEDNNLVTVDWRAPIAAMYYDSNLGEASYIAPEGKVEGELVTKRQYDIENRNLQSFQDVDTVSNDDLLKPYLGVNADNRLKNIVSTIQHEQNMIIRRDLAESIIVQGVAGSGKTTVALHRIAYLEYNHIDKINSDQYLVIGPNRFFVNYISNVLPDLDVNDVPQLTYEEIVQSLLQENFNLQNDQDKLKVSIMNPEGLAFSSLRVSMDFKEMIDAFLESFIKSIIPLDDLTVKGYTILPQSLIDKVYNEVNGKQLSYHILARKIERSCLLLEKYIEEHQEELSSHLHDQFRQKIAGMTKEEVDAERKNYQASAKEVNNHCHQSLKKYFSLGRPKVLPLYTKFLTQLEPTLSSLDMKAKEEYTKTIRNIKRKQVDYEDLPALMYLYYRIYGTKEYNKYRHVVIDEAQDLGEFSFYALKRLLPNATFSIFGDLAQSIYQYRGIKDWSSVIENIFNGQCELMYLAKSYRTTTEIMQSANNITRYLNLQEAEPVIRHGVEVQYQSTSENPKEYIVKGLHHYLEKDYSSIAVICKDEEETKKVSEALKTTGLPITSITDKDTEYKGGICCLSSYLAKGLEFDGVIIADASIAKYDSSKEIDMKLLYVAMTRSLHELTILYQGEITKPLENEVKKKQNSNGNFQKVKK